MPRPAAAVATMLMLLTSIVSWQLIDLAATRPGSVPVAQSQERLGGAALPDSPQFLAEAAIEAIEPAISPRTPLLERLTLAQFARYEIPPHSGAIIMVESGDLRAQVSAVHLAHTAATPSFSRLEAGQSLTAPPRMPVNLANMELQPATVLLLTIPPFDPADEQWAPSIPAPLPAGVKRDMQVTAPTVVAHHGPLSLSMRRMQIAQGTSVAGHLVTESEMVLVDGGSIEVEVRKGYVLPLTRDTPVTRRTGMVVLSPGHGVVARAGAEVAYHTSGQSPATILLVTLAPVEQAR